MEVTSAVQVKVSFNEDLRRFSLLRDASFKQLSENIGMICNIDPNLPVVIKYMDSDKDMITMSSDEELQEALKSLQGGSILRLNVSIKHSVVAPISLTTPYAPPAPSSTGAVSYPSLDGELEDLSVRASATSLDPKAQQFYPQGRPFGHHGPHTHGFPGHHGGPHGFGPHGFPGHRGGPHGFGPHRGGFHHNRFAHPHPYDPHHETDFGAPPAGLTEEERKRWKEEQKNQFKNSRKAWKENWKNANREEREAFKAHKKEMKGYFRAEMEEKHAKRAGVKLVARHVKDVTIADGTELLPNTPFVKTWKLRNEGEAWPAGCRLMFISRKGDNLGGPDSVPVSADGTIAPGQEVEISVNLVAPAEPGRYTSYYKLVTPEGIKFGQRLWISIVVSGSSSSSSSSDDDESRCGPVADMIEAMGFDVKRKHIIRLLVKHDNDVDNVVRILTKKDKGCKKDKKDKCHKHRLDQQ